MSDTPATTSSSSASLPRRWAAHAVAFVLKHSAAGIVPLCTNVAALLEQRDRLAQENESLSRELQACKALFALPSGDGTVTKNKHSLEDDADLTCITGHAAPTSIFEPVTVRDAEYPSNGTVASLLHKKKKGTIETLKRVKDVIFQLLRAQFTLCENDENCIQASTLSMVLQQLHQFGNPWVPLEGCLCEACTSFEGTKASAKALTFNLLDKGHTAIIRRKLLGKICYVGHLDTSAPHWIWLGLDLPYPVGYCDGTLGGKTYFNCKPDHGAFFNVSSVTAIII